MKASPVRIFNVCEDKSIFHIGHLALHREKLLFHGFSAPLIQSRHCKYDHPDRRPGKVTLFMQEMD